MNQKVTPEEIEQIRAFDDFDLVMLISEIHDHGWSVARKTLQFMPGGPIWKFEQEKNNEETPC